MSHTFTSPSQPDETANVPSVASAHTPFSCAGSTPLRVSSGTVSTTSWPSAVPTTTTRSGWSIALSAVIPSEHASDEADGSRRRGASALTMKLRTTVSSPPVMTHMPPRSPGGGAETATDCTAPSNVPGSGAGSYSIGGTALSDARPNENIVVSHARTCASCEALTTTP